MGPNEAKLKEIAGATPGQVEGKGQTWEGAYAQIDLVLDDLRKHRDRARSSWKGSDSDAAAAVFEKKITELTTYRRQMQDSAAAMQEAARTLAEAQSDLGTLPPVGSAPTSPGSLDAGSSKEVRELHEKKVDAYERDQQTHAAALEERERKAGEALRKLDAGIKVSQALLSNAAPRGPEPIDASDQPTGPGSSPGGPGGTSSPGSTGPSSGPVVGGSTSTGQMITAGGAVAGGGAVLGGVRPQPGSGTGTPVRDDQPVDGSPALGAGGGAGMIGGGGASAGTAAAGVIGAGRGLLNRLTGGGAAGAGATPGSPGRTAGMQQGSTLGSRGAGQAGATPSSPGSSAGRPGGGATPGGQTSPGRSAGGAGAGRPAGGTQAGGAQAGARGAGSPSGARSTPGSRGAGAGAGAGRGGQGSDDRDDQTLDHLAFDDDQWIDDDETSPGVIA